MQNGTLLDVEKYPFATGAQNPNHEARGSNPLTPPGFSDTPPNINPSDATSMPGGSKPITDKVLRVKCTREAVLGELLTT